MESPQHHPNMVPFTFALQNKCELPDIARAKSYLSVHDELDEASGNNRFNTMVLCAAVLHGCSLNALKSYVQRYRGNEEEFSAIMRLVTPVLYCAIARNDRHMIDLLLEYGVDPTGSTGKNKIVPPIAFAVIHGHMHSIDTTEIVDIILSAGVYPKTIAKDMKRIARGLNLSQRYALFRASLCPALTARELQSAELHGVKKLIRLPHRIIGQITAVDLLPKYILEHTAASVDDPEPMVIVFAGPPGHGKTELAQQLGALLGVKQDTVACSQIEKDSELFGPKAGYHRSLEGSTLNNLLAQNDGLCSVAFLDEFDKSSSDVCEALLTVMSEGKYIDRRTSKKVDCRKTIWILASNLGDEAIAKFYEKEMKHMKDSEKATTDLNPLIIQLRDMFKGSWGEPFESRIEHVIPFFPFSPGEQAVVAHKFLRKDARNARKDIDLRPEVKRMMGHCIISYVEDGPLCAYMAERGYHRSSGARGVKREAKKVMAAARKVYNNIPERVDESLNDGPFEKLEVKLAPSGNNKHEVKVFRKLEG
ncbi:P-loop containing nucleoside triphosphate hydrolase protein [Ampelomyces quisqualis]|uniref:P-loop containing nucleoside triphosphate hydrolase protein n=1 Tax=Ampelomyces quisqualis TaxID=50730 RepID=A0A6A5Q7Z0_AMPQU|nr:P-loop containing nucleoside triphosphate hydrolase protein [Ampelomyces quisqualis]